MREGAKKLTPKKNYFGAISKKFMRQFEKLLARSSPDFLRQILSFFSPKIQRIHFIALTGTIESKKRCYPCITIRRSVSEKAGSL